MMACNHFESKCRDAERKINKTLRLAEIYKPYLFFLGMYVSFYVYQFLTTYIYIFHHKYGKGKRIMFDTNEKLYLQCSFDDVNTENLRNTIRGSETNMGLLNFDPECIQWDDYFVNTHFRGINKYVLH